MPLGTEGMCKILPAGIWMGMRPTVVPASAFSGKGGRDVNRGSGMWWSHSIRGPEQFTLQLHCSLQAALPNQPVPSRPAREVQSAVAVLASPWEPHLPLNQAAGNVPPTADPVFSCLLFPPFLTQCYCKNRE